VKKDIQLREIRFRGGIIYGRIKIDNLLTFCK